MAAGVDGRGHPAHELRQLVLRRHAEKLPYPDVTGGKCQNIIVVFKSSCKKVGFSSYQSGRNPRNDETLNSGKIRYFQTIFVNKYVFDQSRNMTKLVRK